MKIDYYVPLFISTIICLSGCALLSPHPKKPIINAPQQWRSQDNKTTIRPVSINTLAWWKKFHDPQLNQLMKEALTRNNDLGIATGNLLAAQAALQKVNFSWLPTLGGVGTGLSGRFSSRNIDAPTLPDPISSVLNRSHFDGYFAGFVPDYTLNIITNIKEGQAARFNLAMQTAEKNAVRLGIISQVAGSYFSLLGLKKQLILQEKMIHDATALKNFTTIQYQQGSVSKIRVASIEQFIATLRKKTPKIRHDITKVENALNVLTNKNPGNIITRNNFDNFSTQGIIPINLPSETLKARPDVAIAEYQLEISHAMVGVAVSELFPSISLTGLFGAASLQLTSLINAGQNFGAGLLFSKMPLVDMKVYSDIARAKGKKYAAYFNYIKTVRSAFAEVDNALSQHATVNQSYEQQRIAVEKAQEQYQIANNRYQQGAISYSSTLLVKLNLDYMKAALNQAKMQQMKSIVNLYQVLGGGACT